LPKLITDLLICIILLKESLRIDRTG